MSFKIDINFDSNKLSAKIKAKTKIAQRKLTEQVLNDSNFFIPLDSSSMKKSGIIHTVKSSGVVKWRTPYAHRQYYGDHFDHSKQDNPNACARWFETAKSRYIGNWERLVNEEIKK